MHALNRRQVLGLGALLCAPGSVVFANGEQPLLISGASDGDDKHWVIGLRVADYGIETAFKHQLPARAHHIAIDNERGIYIVVARRPGTWMMLGDLATGALYSEIQVPADRHLFGHGVFSAEHDLFYTTESDFENMTGDSGLIVEWRVTGSGMNASLERLREFPSYGVGPHELLLHPDGDTLIIANGGIRTHPARDRENLNVDTMQPSLAYVDRRSGELLEQHYMPEEFHQSGIRHMDVNADGLVAIAMQFEGEPFIDAPLLATHRRGEELRMLKAAPELQPQLKQYIGALRYDRGGRYFAASAPKGNLITFWDAEAGTLLHTTRARDGCGVCAVQNGFVFSTGTGRVAHIDLTSDNVTEFESSDELDELKVFWDNHMSALA
ncbi:MAG: DUF1513 domain-containing protein [Pseudomonadota bacterium]|nr:DUF1513 domain-containing protein [Pseudomonadota bacterium]